MVKKKLPESNFTCQVTAAAKNDALQHPSILDAMATNPGTRRCLQYVC